MAIQGAATRPAGRGAGSAVLGALLTLAIFVVVFVGFLLAPLALLLVAFLVWTVMKTRQGSDGCAPASGAATADGPSTHGFGAGAR